MLRQPDKVMRAAIGGTRYRSATDGDGNRLPDPTNPNSWDEAESVFVKEIETNGGGVADVTVDLPAGIYRAKLRSQDPFGKLITAELPLQVLDPDADSLNIKLPQIIAAERSSIEPGDEYQCVWGSGYERARAFVEIEHRGKVVQSYWTDPGVTQHMIRQRVSESMRGGFVVRTTMVRENRAYLHSARVEVPWTNKQLQINWEHFVSKLAPAARETWTATIRGPAGHEDDALAATEMVATLYDASLDAYQPHHWISGFGVFRHDYARMNSSFENSFTSLQNLYRNWSIAARGGSLTYRSLPPEIVQAPAGSRWGVARDSRGRPYAFAADAMSMDVAEGMPVASAMMGGTRMALGKQLGDAPRNLGPGGAAAPDLSNVSPRKNLNETAFFFPNLIADANGNIKLEFTMPEALTEWKFMGFAHDSALRSGLLRGTAVTSKDLMVEPNPPRFVREGDELEFTVKVSNQSPTRQSGQVRLSFASARTLESVDDAIGNSLRDQEFSIPAGQSQTLSWRIKIPDEIGFLTYKAVGSTGRLSDGEEGYLPVLSRRVLVTESLPLPMRGKQTKSFDFEKLAASGGSDSLVHQSLSVQMVFQSFVVCSDGVAVPDGVSARMY